MAKIETSVFHYYQGSIGALAVYAVTAIIAGVTLGEFRERFIAITALLAMIPPLLNTGGHICAAFAQAFLLSIVLGGSVHAFLIIFGSDSLGLILTAGVALVSLLLMVGTLAPILAIIVFVGARANLDPDTLAGPIATGLVDAVSILIIYIASLILVI